MQVNEQTHRPDPGVQDEVFVFPASFAQRRIWFLAQIEPDSSAYNVSMAVRLSGRLKIEALHWSLQQIVDRHESLRTTFKVVDGAPVQEVSLPWRLALPLVDLTSAEGEGEEARRLARDEARRPFVLDEGPLLRARLLRLDREEHLLLLSFHHIVSDGWSMGVLVRETAALYEAFLGGRPSPLAQLPIQYADFAVWQQERLQGQVLEDLLAFWREELRGGPQLLDLPLDRPRQARSRSAGGVAERLLPADVVESLQALARGERATPFMALLAAFQALLSRHTGQDDVLVGSPAAGRSRPETEDLIGLFVNTLVLRGDLSGRPGFRELLRRARRTITAAFDHQDLPFERLVEELQPERSLSLAPLFQVLFLFQGNLVPPLELPGLRISASEVADGTAKLDLTLALVPAGRDLTASIEYAVDLFDSTTVQRLLDRFVVLLRSALAHPDHPVADLPLLADAERHALVREWNDTGSAGSPDVCLHELFAQQAALSPEAVALVWGREELTYGELARQVGHLARRLRASGVAMESRVGVLTRRSPAMVAALLGILEAGGAYVGLDPAYPPERLAFMLRDSGLGVLLTDQDPPALVPEGVETLRLEEVLAGPVSGAAPEPFPAPDPESLAYLIYTSGSTGRPKGVAIEHRSAVALVRWAGEAFRDDEIAGVLASTSICFDLSVFELFVPLSRGGAVVLAANALELPALPAAERVTLINTVPSAMAELVRTGRVPAGVMTVNLAGEPLPAVLVESLYRLPQIERVINLYGPSEDTTYSTFSRIARGCAAPPIGRPVDRTRAYLLDRHGQPAPLGAAGELHLAGGGLARGYSDRPELTAERFVPDPWSATPGGRMYRTGDLARHRADGTLEFLGRIDHQVKIRGFRIEPGEIEALLAEHPGVRECAVVVREGPAGRHLVACVAAREGLDADALREHLRPRLPAYMLPAGWVMLKSLPLTPNDKVDRRALERLAPEEAAGGEVPAGPLEELVAGLWAELLGVERVSRHDSFFDLGGHSLLATRALSRLRAALGVELPLRALFEEPTVAGLAARLEAARGIEAAERPPLVATGADSGPLSFAQERLWFIDRLQPGSVAYNIPAALRITGDLDLDALERTLAEILRRHAALRTTFAEPQGRPMQTVAPRLDPSLYLEDLRTAPAEAGDRMLAEFCRPFHLQSGPLVRGLLLRLGDAEWLLGLVMHHIVSDGWSMGVLVRETAALYAAFREGRPSPLPELPVQYLDYAIWQRSWLRGQALDEQLAWWRRELEGAPTVLELPADRTRPSHRSQRGAAVPISLPETLSRSLGALARREGATLFMVLMAVFQTLLHRTGNQDDVLVGTPVANRTRMELEGLIGFFVNTLVLRGRFGGEGLTFHDLLEHTRASALGAFAHQNLPFERLVEELAVERSLSHTPVFQVVLALQNAPSGALKLSGASLAPVAFETVTAKFDLTLMWTEVDGQLKGHLEYATDLFDRTTAQRLLAHLRSLLEAVVAEPGQPVVALPLSGEAERQQALVEWNDTARAYPREAPLHQLFAERAAACPEAPALQLERETVTYGELAARAHRLAWHLLSLGVRPEDRVALCLQRSPESIVAVLGILAAGGAYVPLDPDLPSERLRVLLADSRPRVVLTDAASAASLPTGALLVRLDAEAEAIARCPSSAPRVEISGDSLAYVMYTSGSTGRPKGVAAVHRAVARLVLAPGFARFGPDEVLLQLAPLSFDASTLEIWGALLHGARLVIAPERLISPQELGELLESHRVTLLWLTAGLFHQMVEENLEGLLPVRQLLAGGEALSAPHVRRALAALPECRVIDGYGPTEGTTFTCCQPLDDAAAVGASVPIGRPVGGTRAYVLDAGFRPVPLGVAGELFAGGDGLARGYLDRPDLTAERFVPDPVSGMPGERLYRTGDRVRLRADGAVEFLGRLDRQVKIRGFRIEPGEIESHLLSSLQVAECAVVARDGGTGTILAAYVVPGPGPAPDAATLRELLRGKLPDHMVPARFVFLEALPLTPNGKVDRGALPDPASGGADGGGTPRSAARTATEQELALLFAAVLGAPAVGIEDDFFALGGHSLLAGQVISRLRDRFGVELPLRTLFEHPTVASLGSQIDRARMAGAQTAAPGLVAVRNVDPDERFPLSFSQQRLWFLDQLEPGSSFYNIPVAVRLLGRLAPQVLAASLGEILRRQQSLRTRFGSEDGRPLQIIEPWSGPSLATVELGSLEPAAVDAALRRLLSVEANRPFDLRTGPLLRSVLVRLSAREHVLLLVMHHIVADAWSLGVLTRELSALYEAFAAGRPSPLPELAIQYTDFARWQREVLSGSALEGQLAYWRERLAGAPPVLALPTDWPAPRQLSSASATCRVRLPRSLSDGVAELCRQQRVTPFMALLAAFQVLLGRYARQTDVVVGAPVANRNRVETEALIGFLVNTLVLRTDLAGNPTVPELLARVRETTLGAFSHQDLPFERLVEELQPERTLGHAPLCQVLFTLQSVPYRSSALTDLLFEPMEVDSSTAKFDITLVLSETEDGLLGSAKYRGDLFDASTLIRLLGHFENLLADLLADPARPTAELDLLGESERFQLVTEWNDTAVAREPGSVRDWFERRARALADRPALVFEDESLTYAELDRRANRLANHLRELGAGPERMVALLLERSAEVVVAILAAHKAGAAYVPLDPSWPRERMAWVLSDVRPSVLVTRCAELSHISDPGCPVVRLDADAEILAGRADGPPGIALEPETIAYVIYTSGSTGRAKGVCVEQRQLSSYVTGILGRLGLPEGASYATVSTFAADLGHTVVFASLAGGGCLHVVASDRVTEPFAMAESFERSPIDCLKIVPSHFAALYGAVGARVLPRLRLVLGGEACDGGFAERLAQEAEGLAVLNHYGPTETTVGVTTCGVEPGMRRRTTVPLGRPLPETRTHVLDGELRPVPAGIPGELYIGGSHLARGYLRQPDLTAERFVPDPVGPGRGERLYRTGDLVRHLADGRLEFLGRSDHQVKIRGFRLELSEVRWALTRHPKVRDGVAALVRDDNGSPVIIAYYVSRAPLSVPELRQFLAGYLLEETLPSYYIHLRRLPLTLNGKVNHAALPSLQEVKRELKRELTLPRNETEELLAGIFAQVLGIKDADVHTSFFELGGHSLLAVQVVSRVREVFQVDIKVRVLFEATSIASLAERVSDLVRVEHGLGSAPLQPVPRDGELPLSFAQHRLWFFYELKPESPFYNVFRTIHVEGRFDLAALEHSLGEICRRHEVLRTNFRARKGVPYQVIAPPGPRSVHVVDLSGLPGPAREAEARRQVDAEARAPFRLESEPLLRVRLLRLGRGEHALMLNMHHIASDGWSMGILIPELTELYRAFCEKRRPVLPEVEIQYADFAHWERRALGSEALERMFAYWELQLAGMPTVDLPYDRPRPRAQRFQGGREPLRFSRELTRAAKDLALREGVTLFMALLTGFKALLYLHSGQTDLVLGTNVANRNRVEVESLIGFFVNMLVLRTDLSGNPTFRELLGRVREVTLGAYAHQDVPFDKLVERLRPERSLSHQPLFQVVFSLQNTPLSRVVELPGVTMHTVQAETGTAKYDLVVNIWEDEEGLGGSLEFDQDLFEASTIRKIVRRFERLLEGAVAEPDTHLHSLAIFSEEEEQLLRSEARVAELDMNFQF